LEHGLVYYKVVLFRISVTKRSFSPLVLVFYYFTAYFLNVTFPKALSSSPVPVSVVEESWTDVRMKLKAASVNVCTTIDLDGWNQHNNWIKNTT